MFTSPKDASALKMFFPAARKTRQKEGVGESGEEPEQREIQTGGSLKTAADIFPKLPMKDFHTALIYQEWAWGGGWTGLISPIIHPVFHSLDCLKLDARPLYVRAVVWTVTCYIATKRNNNIHWLYKKNLQHVGSNI